jgi:hypothetical protein
MLLTLFWLTLSIPFVYKAQQQIAKEKIAASQDQSANEEESAGNPLTNTNEEKSGNSFNTLSEEYLHHHCSEELNYSKEITNHLHHAQESTYIAFHGEMLCPPPNA